MSYDLVILSDARSTFSVPLDQAITAVKSASPVEEIQPGRFDCVISTPFREVSIRLTLDGVDEDGESLTMLAAEANNEPWDPDQLPERVNIIYATLPFGLGDDEHFSAVAMLWRIADALGWRVLDHQLGRFIRARYDTTVYLLGDAPIADIHRRMALCLREGGAQRATQSPATVTDHGRVHGFWGDWSMTMRLCDAPYLAREAADWARIRKQEPPWDQVGQSTRYIELWGDADADMDYFNDYISVCQELESQFPGAVLVGVNGEVI